jgi:5-methylthioribose kinase
MSTAPTLEAIRYTRGSLQLLDQLKLPGETVFMDVADCDTCWTLIRDMNVRGAPAIAIAAALALAVELHEVKTTLSTSGEVSDFVAKKLDHLFTSRPTAVNLGEAVRRLKASASALAAAGAPAADAAEKIITECEAMLADDVAANRAIGAFGADALCAAVGENPAAPLRVLTHCNTGSLATAGYGTALGVVRALRERARLEHVYCTETRPYNQGARLTAYEIAFEKMPGTLICESAAASLMKQGKVDAVVVGADRVAENGDTANKIGTFNLAVSCAYHGVPFFVAAPVSTLDPSTKRGDDIVIEDRPAEEITHFKGVRVAAEGIDVWNPSFDVTPACLIAGIITEKGVVQKTSDGNFEIGTFLASASASGAPVASETINIPAGFYAMDVSSVLEYCASKPSIASALGGTDTKGAWRAKEVGDGNINFVYIVTGADEKRSVVVKQGLPFVRIVGEAWPLTQERVRYEAEALQTAHGFCPAHVPEVFLYDRTMSVIAMRFLEPPHIISRGGIVKGTTYPRLAEHLGEYLATTLFGSSAIAVGCEAFRTKRQAFGQNEAMCALTEQVIFTEPYAVAENNKWTSPQLDSAAKSLRSDAALKTAIADLKRKFVTDASALLHGDLHTGSIMCTETTTFVIDHEFAFYGPMGFDVGAFLANLLLAFFSQDGHEKTGSGCDRSASRAWLLGCVCQTWRTFEKRFIELWDATGVREGTAGVTPASVYDARVVDADSKRGAEEALRATQKKYLSDVLRESLGYAGAKMTRRVVGIAHVADLESIEDPDIRAKCELAALACGRRLILEAGTLSIEDVKDIAESLRAK